MGSLWAFSAALYVAGVAWGLLMIDAPPAARLGLALLWPLSPFAFVVTIAILLVASLIAFPAFGVLVLIAVGLAWWALFST